jgi:hypothetical protein
LVGIGTVGDGIAAFGAVGGALWEAGGGLVGVGVWAHADAPEASALISVANAPAATILLVTTGSPLICFRDLRGMVPPDAVSPGRGKTQA